jgi:hypothetical protein
MALMRLLLRLLFLLYFINDLILFVPRQLNLELHMNSVVSRFEVVVKVNEQLFRVFQVVDSHCYDVQFVELL